MAFSSSFSSSTRPPPQFDVFLSFRGNDTRHNFTSHLRASLHRKGIDAFIDDKLRRGNDISALLKRIERSKISIIIFSSNFANSDWCLEEVVKILECREKNKQVVVPIFYKVRKSDVENQTGSFGIPFKGPEETFPGKEGRIPAWKAALAKASNIAGHVVTEDSSEADVVDKIARDTFRMLHDMSPSETEGLVGMKSRLEQLEKLLSYNELGCVRIIGVLGMAGIGKTTIADCIYKRTCSLFNGCCFLANIRDEARRQGLDHLQQKLLSKVLDEKDLDIGAPETAHEAFKDRLRNKRLLIVLDDVDSEKQIKFLMGHRKWFQEGSRIIITGRDKQLLKKFVDEIFEVPRLNDREALQLFSLNAFTNNFFPAKEFMDLSNMFVDYAKGHPLALKLLGSDLCDREKLYWISKLDRLQSRPDGKIQEVLEISYEELNDEQKNVFLDIACFFRSEGEDYVTSLLNSHDIDGTAAVRDLIDKCLLTISHNRLEMHELLHAMGKGIALEASTTEAGNRSRLWNPDDICHVLKNKTGTGKVRGIFLDMSRTEKMNLSSDVFRGMCNLRYLKFYNSHCSRGCEADCRFYFPEGLNFLSDELTYLHWRGFPLRNLPPDFNPKNLVDFQLPYSQVEQLWEDNKNTGKLKWIDLSHSQNLWNLSGMSKAQNVERLNLKGCTSLVKLPSSIHCMDKLVYLNLQECASLKSLPKGINLESLKTLILSGCSSLRKFPQISENVESLHLDGTALKRLPESIGNFSKLAALNLKNCGKLKCIPSNIWKLKSLQELILSGCSRLTVFPEIEEDMECLEILLLDDTAIGQMPKIMHLSNLKTFSFCRTRGQDSMGLMLPSLTGWSLLTDLYLADCNLCELPDDLSQLSTLQCVCLSKNNIDSLPESIKKLHNLKWLDLKNCKKLHSIPMLPSNLQYLDAHGCDSLENVANPLTLLLIAERIHSAFIFSNCFKLSRIAQDNILAHAQLKSQLMANASLKHYHQAFTLEPLVGICFPGTEIPLWFSHQRIGSSMKTQLPPHWCDSKFVGFALCAVVSFKDCKDDYNRFSVKCTCKVKNEDGDSHSFSCTVGGWNEPYRSSSEQARQISSDHVFLSYNNCFHIKRYHGENKLDKCCYTTASFKFYVTDDNKRKLEGKEVIKCGLSLLYAPDENDCRLQGIPSKKLDQATLERERGHNNYICKKSEGKRVDWCYYDEEIPNAKRARDVNYTDQCHQKQWIENPSSSTAAAAQVRQS